MNTPLQEILDLRTFLGITEVPGCVIAIEYCHRKQWHLHVTEEFFRAHIEGSNLHTFHVGGSEAGKSDKLYVLSNGVQIFCIVPRKQEYSAETRQAAARALEAIQEFRGEILEGDLLTKNRRGG